MNKAIFETELDNAAGKRDWFSVVKGTDDPEQHIREKMVIADMKDDYSIMKNAMMKFQYPIVMGKRRKKRRNANSKL